MASDDLAAAYGHLDSPQCRLGKHLRDLATPCGPPFDTRDHLITPLRRLARPRGNLSTARGDLRSHSRDLTPDCCDLTPNPCDLAPRCCDVNIRVPVPGLPQERLGPPTYYAVAEREMMEKNLVVQPNGTHRIETMLRPVSDLLPGLSGAMQRFGPAAIRRTNHFGFGDGIYIEAYQYHPAHRMDAVRFRRSRVAMPLCF